MSPQPFQPAGFRRPPAFGARRRGKVIPFRRGLGDAGSDYAAIAAQLTPGSAAYQLFTGCAQNPGAPACAGATTGALSSPYLTASQETAMRAAIASGGAIPSFPANIGAPPGTSLPTASEVQAAQAQGYTTAQGTFIPGSQPATSNSGSNAASSGGSGGSTSSPAPVAANQPVQAVQPAGATQPTDNSQPAPPSSFLSQQILGFPLWLWGIAAVAGYFLFSQSGGHYGR